MTNKTIHLLAGMPQAGASLLSSILAQNPRFEASKPGGVLDAIYILTKAWPQIPEFQTAPNENGKIAVMKAMLQGYYASSDRPVAFDKSRSWVAHLETAELLLGRKAKVLVPVRDLREILASFELLWRQSADIHQSRLEQKHYIEFQSVEGRCAIWLRPENTVGLAYSRIEDAIQRGFRDRLFFVHYEALTSRPKDTMAAIYNFLGEQPFSHDFNTLQQVTPTADEVEDFPNAHVIRPQLTSTLPRASQVLGQAADRYKGPYVWNVNA
jgi:sulfotransferase